MATSVLQHRGQLIGEMTLLCAELNAVALNSVNGSVDVCRATARSGTCGILPLPMCIVSVAVRVAVAHGDAVSLLDCESSVDGLWCVLILTLDLLKSCNWKDGHAVRSIG